MNGLTRRLFRLESLAMATGCRLCRHWQPATVCDPFGVCLRPDVCPVCDRSVPVAERVIIAGIDLAAV